MTSPRPLNTDGWILVLLLVSGLPTDPVLVLGASCSCLQDSGSWTLSELQLVLISETRPEGLSGPEMDLCLTWDMDLTSGLQDWTLAPHLNPGLILVLVLDPDCEDLQRQDMRSDIDL